MLAVQILNVLTGSFHILNTYKFVLIEISLLIFGGGVLRFDLVFFNEFLKLSL